MTAYEIIDRPERDELGEGPVWDVADQSLYWVDIVDRRVFRLYPATGEVRRWRTPSMVSVAVPTVGGDLLVALEDGAHRLDKDTGGTRVHAAPEHVPGNRSNDAKVDNEGRLLLGTMFNTTGPSREVLAMPGPTGALFRIDPDGGSERLIDHVGIPNALAFSPDGRRVTFADTRRDVIWSFAYTPEGRLEDRRVLLQGGPGHPDGAAMDAEGCLWNARWGAGVVIRITPDGRIDRTLELPVAQPSCCAFGGPDLKTLYVTSARQSLQGLGPEALDGALFAVPMEVTGVPTAPFGG